jgi:hypothetical protein
MALQQRKGFPQAPREFRSRGSCARAAEPARRRRSGATAGGRSRRSPSLEPRPRSARCRRVWWSWSRLDCPARFGACDGAARALPRGHRTRGYGHAPRRRGDIRNVGAIAGSATRAQDPMPLTCGRGDACQTIVPRRHGLPSDDAVPGPSAPSCHAHGSCATVRTDHAARVR